MTVYQKIVGHRRKQSVQCIQSLFAEFRDHLCEGRRRSQNQTTLSRDVFSESYQKSPIAFHPWLCRAARLFVKVPEYYTKFLLLLDSFQDIEGHFAVYDMSYTETCPSVQ